MVGILFEAPATLNVSVSHTDSGLGWEIVKSTKFKLNRTQFRKKNSEFLAFKDDDPNSIRLKLTGLDRRLFLAPATWHPT